MSDGESLIDVGGNDGVGGDTDVGETGVGAAGTRPEDTGNSSAIGAEGSSSSATTETARPRKGDGTFVVPAVACSVLTVSFLILVQAWGRLLRHRCGIPCHLYQCQR